jgi:hypothetical protein
MRHGRLGIINWADRLAILTLDTFKHGARVGTAPCGARAASDRPAGTGPATEPAPPPSMGARAVRRRALPRGPSSRARALPSP